MGQNTSQISDVAVNPFRAFNTHPVNDQTIKCYRFFSMYRLGFGDQSDSGGGRIEGGKTIWGKIAGTISNLGLTPEFILWGTGWQNLVLMSQDMPYWKSDQKDGKKEPKAKAIEEKEEIEEFFNLN